MADSVNLSLDEIIRASRSRGIGGTKGRGGGVGRGRGRGRGGRAASRTGTRARSRSRSQSLARPQAELRGRRGRGGAGRAGRAARGLRQSRARSRSRSRLALRPRSGSRPRSASRPRSSSRPRSASRSRSRSRSRQTLLTQRGRADLDPSSIQSRLGNYRGGLQTQVRRSRSNPNLRGDIHSRLGVVTRRGMAGNVGRPLAVAKRGIAKRGRGLTTRNRYSTVGLRSDQIIKEQQRNMLFQNNIIQSQTFTRSRHNSLTRDAASQLTISVANNLAKRRRRNSVGNPNYLDRESLMQLTNQLGGFRNRRGPGSVSSVGSNRSMRSTRSSRSGGARARGRGRGRARGRLLTRNFISRPVLNEKLQKEIAAIQGKTSNGSGGESPSGINFTPTPASTKQTLHQRFASS